MHHRHRLIQFVCLCLFALAAGFTLPAGAPRATAAPGAQLAPRRGYTPRPVPIRRLPGGRVLRIVSRTHGGVTNRVCMLASLDDQGIGFRMPNLGDEAMLAPVIFLPGSGQLASAINAPAACVLAGDQPVTATALAPDGESRLPALIVPEGRISIVSLPIEAFTVPGDWQLEITAPVSAAFTITIPPLAQPSMIVSGDALLLQGYQPGEALRGVMMANRCMTSTLPGSDPLVELPPLDDADAARCAENQVSALLEPVQVFDAAADEHGAAFVQRVDPEHDLTYLIVGATTPQLLSNITFSEDLDAAIAENGFPVTRDALFRNSDQGGADPLTDDGEPTPAVMPSTGASDWPDLSGVGGAVTLLLLAAGIIAARGVARRRTN